MEKKTKMSPPWTIYYRKLEALFGQDPDIQLVYDNVHVAVKMYVANQKKAEAIEKLLPSKVSFGSVDLEIVVIPSNKMKNQQVELFRDAFDGNAVVTGIQTVEGAFSNPITYVFFKKEVVQYFSDDLGDAHGMCSTLYQEIAKEVFEEVDDGIFFCTDVD